MIIPGFAAQLDAVPQAGPKGPANGADPQSAGFLALLGAALKGADASAAPVAKPSATAVATDNLPGPGDTEQADGWRGTAVALESVISLQTPTPRAAEPIRLPVSSVEAPAPAVVEQGDGWRELDETPASIPMPPSLAPAALRDAQLRPTRLMPQAIAESKPAVANSMPGAVTAPVASQPVAGPAVAPAPTTVVNAAPARLETVPAPERPKFDAPVPPVAALPIKAQGQGAAEVQPMPATVDVKPEAKPKSDPKVMVATDPAPIMQPGLELARIAAQALTQPAPVQVRPSQPATSIARSAEVTEPVAIPAAQPMIAPIARPQTPKLTSARITESAGQPKEDAVPLTSIADEPVTAPVATTAVPAETAATPLPVDLPARITQVVTNRVNDKSAAQPIAPVADRPSAAAVASAPAVDAEPVAQDNAKQAAPRPKATPASASEPNVSFAGTHASLNATAHKNSEPAVSQPQATSEATPVRAPAEPVVLPKTTERVTLELPGHDGETTRVRISVRGDQVRTTLISNDSATSARLASQAPELERALAARGFHEAEVVVPTPLNSTAPRDGGSVAALSVAASGSSSGEALQGNNRHADGSAGDSRQGTAERDRESPDRRADEQQPRQGRSHQRTRRERAK